MRLLYVADGRSPIALNWISYFVESGNEVHLISTFDCIPDLSFSSLHILPVGFSEFQPAAGASTGRDSYRGMLRRMMPVPVRTQIRHWLAPLTLANAAKRLAFFVEEIQPDLLHAMRIPYEGMVAAMALNNIVDLPMLLSVWGNDFTLHAPSTPFMSRYTRLALARTDALHTDCRRDMRLAEKWGFDPAKPAVVLPGAGGIQLDLFYSDVNERQKLPEKGITVINPRGIRAYVRNDIFFRAVPLVLDKDPAIRFICPAMADEPQAWRWIRELGIDMAVELLPRQSRPGMASLYRKAEVAVSPSLHDGTPNTLLEAMACGCFPIAGDIESIHEWIQPGINGLLFDPNDPKSLADAILYAADQSDLRMSAAKYNTRLIAERAEHWRVMREADEFYQRLVNVPGHPVSPVSR
jgi:glycosyltransferase involved in cell wall biosynthesis